MRICGDATHFVRSIVGSCVKSSFHSTTVPARRSRVSTCNDKPPVVTSAVDPDLAVVRAFILEMIAKGAIAALVTAILALLVRMRDLNTELMRKLASKSKKRPPSETMRRLQRELPLLWAPPANDVGPVLPKKEKKKRGPKTRAPHGRPVLPSHLPRVPNVILVPANQRTCPHCHVELKRVRLKVTAEKLEVQPSRFIVSQTQVETCSCPKCHEHIISAPTPDEVVDCVFRSTLPPIPLARCHSFRQRSHPFRRRCRSAQIGAKRRGLSAALMHAGSEQGRLDDQPSVSVVFSPSPFFFLIDGPFNDSTCALWTSRSQIASATVGSASISCQVFVGAWLVTTVDRWS